MMSTPSPQDQEIIELLEALSSIKAEYPPELLAKRRTAFMVQLALSEKFSVQNFHPPEDEKIVAILENLKPVRAEYPSILMAKQRAAFLDQAAKRRKVGWLESLRSAIQSRMSFNLKDLATSKTNEIRIQFVVASILAIACVGLLLYGNRDRLVAFTSYLQAGRQVAQSDSISPTASLIVAKTTCTPGRTSSPCLTYGFDKEPGKSPWVSKNADSWINIDTGQTAAIHMVEFDKTAVDNSTGTFTISVALPGSEYKQVYDSRTDNYTETVVGGEKTIQVSFEPVLARYVRITVTDPGMSINEVRAFAVIPPPTAHQITEDTQVRPPPTVTSSSTPLPTKTPTSIPTRTPIPTYTRTPSSTPTATATATSTPSSTPTSTSTTIPTATPTETPVPTNTPVPTDTPLPTNTPLPTDTPLPTNTPLPTDTPLPTNTAQPTKTPLPTNTSVPIQSDGVSIDGSTTG